LEASLVQAIKEFKRSELSAKPSSTPSRVIWQAPLGGTVAEAEIASIAILEASWRSN